VLASEEKEIEGVRNLLFIVMGLMVLTLLFLCYSFIFSTR
jgi:hypothetical protein